MFRARNPLRTQALAKVPRGRRWGTRNCGEEIRELLPQPRSLGRNHAWRRALARQTRKRNGGNANEHVGQGAGLWKNGVCAERGRDKRIQRRSIDFERDITVLLGEAG